MYDIRSATVPPWYFHACALFTKAARLPLVIAPANSAAQTNQIVRIHLYPCPPSRSSALRDEHILSLILHVSIMWQKIICHTNSGDSCLSLQSRLQLRQMSSQLPGSQVRPCVRSQHSSHKKILSSICPLLVTKKELRDF